MGENQSMIGKQIRLFLVDGTPGGLTTAEITNWTGHVLTGPRSDVGTLLQRDEARRTGVYLLLGDDWEVWGEARCYIGEADVVADRVRYHLRDKEFWDRIVVITSKDANLTKSHGRYLESKLIELATKAGRSTLENGTAPPAPPLPEADASDMDEFLAQLQIVLPVLGVNVIRVRPIVTKPGGAPTSVESPIFTLHEPGSGVNARAQEIDGEFTADTGSRGPAILWGLVCAGVWLAAWAASKALDAKVGRRRKNRWLLTWSPYVVGLPIFLVCLYAFFEHVANLLPASF